MIVRLCQVQINKTDTCLTYVLKRSGISPSLYQYENIDKGFDISSFSSIDKLEYGDIVLWDANAHQAEMAVAIDKNGLLTIMDVWARVHFAIYEGNGMISDCSRRDNISSLPRLRMRKLEEVERMPDKVLKFKFY
jgi:hypothetical protein